ncbi:kinase-like protein [Fomitiporia mediterranea MF3/22]|uniref:kinase-like protein n=1 Tax=Fomitiporia mediterranea (strain MF3/22) TaxID=694068 RepID=UPI000440763C|nr:kinase-like protein [Fomitiporia mediterranea MF3/22]EJD06479.1 kinase-like protein [Fomitiporia mediterranea MF3/22]
MYFQLLEKEVYVWSKLRHENILPLLGYAFDMDTEFPMLISEWMENGSAWTYVNSNPQCDLLRLVISGAARGPAYLHKNNFIHSDIKSDNVLVSSSGDALICDFGYTRIINASQSLAHLTTGNGMTGTAHYLSYELIAYSATYSEHSKESDVWAFGMTVYVSNLVCLCCITANQTQGVVYSQSSLLLIQPDNSSHPDFTTKTSGISFNTC